MIRLAALLFGLASGESPRLDWDRLLASRITDAKLHSVDRRLELLEESASVGWWKKAELQGEVAGFDRQEIGSELKIQPFGWGERTALQKQWEGKSLQLKENRRRILGQALAQRYVLGLEWIFTRRRMDYHRAMQTMYRERVKAHLDLVGSQRFDPQDLILSQQQAANLDGDLMADQNDLAEIEASLLSMVPGSREVSLDTSILLPSDQMTTALDALPRSVDSSFPLLAIASGQVNGAARSLELVRATRRNWIGDLHVGVEHKSQDKVKKSTTTTETEVVWNAGISLPLPFGDTRGLEERKARLEMMDRSGEVEQVRAELAKDLDQLRMSIGSRLRRIAICDSFVRKVDAGALFTDFMVRSGSDPLLLLKGRMALLQSRWDLQKLRHELLCDYVKLLELTGRLADHPERNLIAKVP